VHLYLETQIFRKVLQTTSLKELRTGRKTELQNVNITLCCYGDQIKNADTRGMCASIMNKENNYCLQILVGKPYDKRHFGCSRDGCKVYNKNYFK